MACFSYSDKTPKLFPIRLGCPFLGSSLALEVVVCDAKQSNFPFHSQENYEINSNCL